MILFLLEMLSALESMSPERTRLSSGCTLFDDLPHKGWSELVVEPETGRLCLLRPLGSALRDRVEDASVEVLRESGRDFRFPLSSDLRGMPSHFEFTLGMCSGILTEDTPDMPGGIFRPGLRASCFRDSFCICRKASVDGSFVNSVPRKEGFFFSFTCCATDDVVEEPPVAGLGAGLIGEEEYCTDKPGDRGPLSTSDREVIMAEVVRAVFIVRAVSVMLVVLRAPGRDTPWDRRS